MILDSRPKKPKKGKSQALKIASNFSLLLLAMAFLLPLAWLVLASFDRGAGVSSIIPSELTLDNYIQILRPEVTLLPLWNSLILSGGTAVLTVVVAVLAAYPLSRYKMRFNKGYLYTILFATSLPITAIMVPVYSLFVRLGQLDSIFAVILFMSASSLPMAIWLTKNFMDGVPVSLEEAAWVDGASSMRALRQIVVPLMRPGLSVVFIFVFIQAWGNFFVPFLLLFSRDKEPAAVTVFRFFGQYGQIAYGELAAFSIIYALPVVMLYMVLAKSLGGSFAMSGAVKG
jgi:multiple sugar transport system permease protein